MTASESELFPESDCVAALGELSAWTPVQSILSAARHLESRPSAEDELAPFLISPFDDDGVLRHILIKSIQWFIAGYRPPMQKIAIAAARDPLIRPETLEDLASRRFRPTIKIAPAGAITNAPPNRPCLWIEDDPVVIEMVQAPIICLMMRLHDSNELARKMARLRKQMRETTGGQPTIIHRHYADSRLAAVLEALCFYLWGLDLGPRWAEPGTFSSDISYRSVNIVGVPPIDKRAFEAAYLTMEDMLASLK